MSLLYNQTGLALCLAWGTPNSRIVFSDTIVDLCPCTFGLLIPFFEMLEAFAAQGCNLILSADDFAFAFAALALADPPRWLHSLRP
jgi:hypothetical protein